MKRILLSTMVILIALTSMTAQKKLNGKMKTETRSVSDYERVHVSGSFDVVLVSGKEGEISIKGDSKAIANIDIAVNNGTLNISTKKGVKIKYNDNESLTITVPVEEIDGVSLSGSGDISSTMTIKARELKVSLTGSGDIELPVEAARLLSTITGSGDIELTGTANYLRVEMTGSGDFEGKTLQSNMTEVTLTGSGDAEVNAHEYIMARVSGSGDVAYIGNPSKEDIKVSGSGDVHKH